MVGITVGLRDGERWFEAEVDLYFISVDFFVLGSRNESGPEKITSVGFGAGTTFGLMGLADSLRVGFKLEFGGGSASGIASKVKLEIEAIGPLMVERFLVAGFG